MTAGRMLVVLALAGLIAITVAACARTPSPSEKTVVPSSAPPPPPMADAPAPTPPKRPARSWPALDHEPQLGVLLVRGKDVSLRLLTSFAIPGGGTLPAGQVTIVPDGDGFRIGSHRLPGPRIDLTSSSTGATLALGSGKDAAEFAGDLRLSRDRGQVEVIELVGLESWLPGVLQAEMNPRWPVAALAAQAIVARSYAAARWQARRDEAWQLVRGTADVAYDGLITPSAGIEKAIAETRGELLVYNGQAVLARFHACSGGRTEDSEHLWPGALLPDGTTPLARFMRPVDDPASERGARGLGWGKTHQSWKVTIPLADITTSLRAWAAKTPSRPKIGQVRSIAIASLHASGRADEIAVTHHLPQGERTDNIDALEFRLAVGAIKLRSLWWERSTAVSAGGGSVVIEGHGFGHGVGLPQVSAWALANDGVKAEDIVARYYPATGLIRAWR